MSWNLAGKKVIITGGGNGIGRAVAHALFNLGSQVAVLDKDIDAARDTCALSSPNGGTLTPWRCDVSSEDEIQSTIEAVLKEFSSIDFLFNNAGINRRKALKDWTSQDWNELISVNFVGAFCVARTVGLHMVERRSGSIVNMSALGGGVIGLGRGTEIYAGTKGAVAAMSRDLAAEWAPFGVRVNCIAPGWIETDMNAALLNHSSASQKVIERVPLGRWGLPGDIVGPVLFLASDHSAYITGHLLPIDGGASSIIRLTSDEVIR
jgi:NAD(P)-dependent dehydrogenase (short-subunit alcohol dehydrogenase family)